jgi:hypothetical protein
MTQDQMAAAMQEADDAQWLFERAQERALEEAEADA